MVYYTKSMWSTLKGGDMSILKFCPNCNITKRNAEFKAVLAATGTRYKKEDVLEFNKGFLWGIKSKDNKEYTVCPFCGTTLMDASISQEDFAILEDVSNCNRQFLEAMIKLHDEDIIEYELKMSQFKAQADQTKTVEEQKQNENLPKCPTCQSTNIEKISFGKKAFGGAMFGIFSSDVRKIMHCKNCGYKW